MTKLREGAIAESKDDDAVSLGKETLEDLDAPEDASEDAVGGSATRTNPGGSGSC